MPLGKLTLKGGETLGGVKKKKKKKQSASTPAALDSADRFSSAADEAAAAPTQPKSSTHAAEEQAQDAAGKQSASAHPARVDPKLQYEREFEHEAERMSKPKARANAWGVTYQEPPPILHGYDRKVTGDTYEERLDLRCAKKADRMCK